MAKGRPQHTRIALLGVLVAAVACGLKDLGESAATLKQEVDSTDAIVRVRNSGVPPQWTLEPVLTVGSEAAMGEPAPDEFGRITAVSTDREGAVWVADGFSHDIRVFGADGSLTRRIGREGQGPGEFLAIYSLAWVGDVLLALDLGNGRVAELSESGQWLGARPAPGRVSGPPALLRFYAVTDTTAFQWSLKSASGKIESVWIEHRPGGVVGEWPQLSPVAPEPTGIRCDAPDGSISFFDMPFGGRVLQHPAETGMAYVAWTRDYRIALLNAEGDTLRVIERDRPRVSVSDAEWEAARSEYAEFMEDWPGAKCDPSDIARPSTKPAIRNLLVDTSGRLWVEAYTDDGMAWDVFDSQGLLRGTVPSFDYVDRVAPSIRGNLLAWVEADSLGVERVRVALIDRGPAS